MAEYPQSTAYVRMFKMVSSSDHLSAKTGLTPTVNISKAGAAFGAAGGAVAEVANGWYKVTLSTTDTNTLGDLAYYITGAGADDTDFVDQVVKWDKGIASIPNAVAGAAGGIFIAGTNAATTVTTALTTTFTGNLTGSVGSVTGAVGSVTGAVGSIATGGIVAASFAAGAIDAAAIAADAIGSSELAASATAEIATAIWQDATAGDFTTTGSIGKSLFTSGAVPGAAGGLFIAGTNAATTITTALTTTFTGNLTGSVASVSGAVGSVTGAVGSVTGLTASDVGAIKTKTDFLPSAVAGAAGGLFIAGSNAATTFATLTVTGATTLTGNVSAAAGITITQSTTNGNGLSITGNGTGYGVLVTSGNGSAATGMRVICAATNGNGLDAYGAGTGDGIHAQAGGSAGGAGIHAVGSTSGYGLFCEGSAGAGIYAVSTSSYGAYVITQASTSALRVECTGTNGDAATFVKAGTGVDIRGNITGNLVGTVTTTTNVTTVNGLASGVITATSIAADAIGASELASDAVTEIAAGVWASVLSGILRTNTAQAGAGTTITLDASASATNDLYAGCSIEIVSGTGAGQSNIIASYVGSTKVATVSSTWATNPASDSVFAIRGLGIVPTTTTDIEDAVWDAVLTDHADSGSTGEALATAGGSGASAADIADAVWDEARSGHTTSGTFGQGVASVQGNVTGSVASVTAQLTAAQIATGVWQDTTSGDFTVSSSIGKSLYTAGVVPGGSGGHFIAGTNAATTVTTAFTTTFTGSLTGSVASVTGAVGSVTGAVGSVTGAVGSVTGNVGGSVASVTAVSSGAITSSSFASAAITATAIATDAIGAAELATDAVTEIVAGVWNALLATYTVSGSMGLAMATAGGSGASAAEIADAVWDEARSGHVGGGSFGEGVASVQGNITGSVASVTTVSTGGITAASIAADAIGASELATDAVTEIVTAVWAAATRVLTAGTNIVLAKGTGVTGFNDLSTTTVEDTVWDALLSNHADTGSVGAALGSVYHARIQFTRDEANTQDEYTVQWFKNGTPVTSGITGPTVQVVKRSNGADLVASTAMTQIGSTGAYKADTVTSERQTPGEAVIVVVGATIDGGSRTWREPLGRDSSV